MKLIHLSDLHLGRRIGEVSLLEEQSFILRRILQIIADEKPDAVLICGDVYDKTVPSAEAVCLFDEFLVELSAMAAPVLIISGNHDSPERLAFGGRLMESAGIHIAPVYDGKVEAVCLEDEHGRVSVWMLPFIKPAHVRRFFPDAKAENYTQAVAAAISQMPLDKGGRNVLMTHQFVAGAASCESEEISVGGSENVEPYVFADFDYVALGHIHGPQNIGSNRIRYCGTPLKYSFSEAQHLKSLTVVQLGRKGELELRTVALVPRHDLRVLRGSFAQIEESGRQLKAEGRDYLHIVLTDEEDIPEAVSRLRGIYPNLIKLSYDNSRTREERLIDGPEDVKSKSPLELFEELYQLQNNKDMSAEQKNFSSELIEKLWEGSL